MFYRRSQWLGLASLLAACGPPPGETLYQVMSAGMVLPVVEFGPSDAEVAIVHIHGGPGESRLDTELGAEQRLGTRFLYTTWAQRTTPFATGHLRQRTATLAQHVADLEAVLATVHQRHPDKRIVITGFSWGGAMAIDYMASDPAPFVAGVVLVGALVHARTAIDDSWAMLRAHGEARMADGAPDAAYWSGVVGKSNDYAAALDRLTAEDYLTAFVQPRVTACRRMREDLGLPDNVENRRKGVYDRFHLLPPTESVALRWMVDEVLDIDLRPRLSAVQRPALVLWGALDCNSPLPTGESTWRALGSMQKTLRVLTGIPHDVMDAAPTAYADEIGAFVDALP